MLSLWVPQGCSLSLVCQQEPATTCKVLFCSKHTIDKPQQVRWALLGVQYSFCSNLWCIVMDSICWLCSCRSNFLLCTYKLDVNDACRRVAVVRWCGRNMLLRYRNCWRNCLLFSNYPLMNLAIKYKHSLILMKKLHFCFCFIWFGECLMRKVFHNKLYSYDL